MNFKDLFTKVSFKKAPTIPVEKKKPITVIHRDRVAFVDAEYELTPQRIREIKADTQVTAKLKLGYNKACAYKKAFVYSGNKKIDNWVDQVLVPKIDWSQFSYFVSKAREDKRSIIYIEDDPETIYKFYQLPEQAFAINHDPMYGDDYDLLYNMENMTRKYPQRFMLIMNDADDKHPDGQSDLKPLLNYVRLKRELEDIMTTWYYKASIPSFAVIYETDKTGQDLIDESTTISNALANIENSAGFGLPNVGSVVALQPNSQTSFTTALDWINNQINILLMGSDLTDSKKAGTYAQAKVGAEYIEGNIKSLAITIQKYTNLLIRWAVNAYFGVEYAAPFYVYDFSEPVSLDVLKFQKESNFPISFSEANKVFALPKGMIPPPDDILRSVEDLYVKEKETGTETPEDKTEDKTEDSTPDSPDDNSPEDDNNAE